MATTEKIQVNPFEALLVDTVTVPKAKRGRKATIVPELRDAISVVRPGKSLPLGSLYRASTKEQQGKIGQVIRTHWNMFRADDGKCSISWVDGEPFLSIKETV